MNNKYQKALDELQKSELKFNAYDNQKEEDEAPRIFDLYHHEIFILQELIDDQIKLEEKFNEQSKAYGKCCMDRHCFEQALDKACIVLSLYDGDNWSNEQWKEYLLEVSK